MNRGKLNHWVFDERWYGLGNTWGLHSLIVDLSFRLKSDPLGIVNRELIDDAVYHLGVERQ